MAKQTTLEKLHQRTQQILVHSYIYYEFNTNIIEDYKYDQYANELIEIIKQNPELLDQVEYGYMFKDYAECGSGFNLNYRHPKIVEKAQYLLELRRRKGILK